MENIKRKKLGWFKTCTIQLLVVRMIFVIGIYIISIQTIIAQTHLYTTKIGNITFRSEAPLEIITASSNSLEGVIDMDELTFAFKVPIQTFKGFNNGLQQQHFYENYLETSKYPDASFSGKLIEKIDLSKPGTYQVRAKGQLKIHGRTQERIIKTELISDGNEIRANAQFMVPLVDHQIEIPKVVNQKIAQEINVVVRATLSLSGKS